MNDNHSRNELLYRLRWVSSIVRKAVTSFPVIVITGARQVGKSMMLQNEFKDFRYVSLDEYESFEQAETSPESLWKNEMRVIIDEAQKAPKLFHAVKLAVDKTNRQIRIILSGSSNILLMKQISESLAGRAVYLEMMPMTYNEMYSYAKTPSNFFKILEKNFSINNSEIAPIDTINLLLKGFMPALINMKTQEEVNLWWEGYITTYLERDLRDLINIDSLIDFRRVMKALVLRSGGIINQTEIARDTGVSQSTVSRYCKVLEISYFIHNVSAYHSNRTKRIIKSPKLYFADPGIVSYLAGYHDVQSLRNSREIGGIFETLILLHLRALAQLLTPRAQIYYWRTTTNEEVDFVIEHGRTIVPVEVKLTASPNVSDARGLLAFLDEYPAAKHGILLHTGSAIKNIHLKVVAVPWWWIVF